MVIFFIWLPSIAIVRAAYIVIPLFAPSLVAAHICFIIEITVAASPAIGYISRERWPVVVWQGAFAARFHVLRDADRNHLIDCRLLRRMAADNFAVIFDGGPAIATGSGVRNEVRHYSSIVW